MSAAFSRRLIEEECLTRTHSVGEGEQLDKRRVVVASIRVRHHKHSGGKGDVHESDVEALVGVADLKSLQPSPSIHDKAAVCWHKVTRKARMSQQTARNPRESLTLGAKLWLPPLCSGKSKLETSPASVHQRRLPSRQQVDGSLQSVSVFLDQIDTERLETMASMPDSRSRSNPELSLTTILTSGCEQRGTRNRHLPYLCCMLLTSSDQASVQHPPMAPSSSHAITSHRTMVSLPPVPTVR
eukprot:766680-Hanusia_phi.AAC.4